MIQRPANIVFESVAELINPQTRTWNLTSVHAAFLPSVAEHILCIPLSQRPLPDRLGWGPAKRGNFTVKSAYWIARQQVLGSALASCSSGDPFKELWKRLWKARVPGKVLICAWRACNNLLPTREQLLRKGYDGEVSCLLCNYKMENNAHLFCKCPTALQILSGPSFSLQHTILPNMHFKEWMLEQALNLKPELFEKLLMIIWGLWKNRNEMLWESRFQSSNDIMLGSLTWLDEFQRARNQCDKLPVQRGAKKWHAATISKLNVDGAFIPQESHGGTGGVLQSSCGTFQAAFTQPVYYVNSAHQVELLAIKESLQFIKTLHLQNVILETDCLVAVQEITGTAATLSAMSSLVLDIQRELETMPGVLLTFAPRTCNRIAHRLANLAFESKQQATWQGATPPCIVDLVLQESNPNS